MKTLTIPELAEALLAGDNYIMLTHRRPDGDTIGSSALLCMGLRQLGKTAHVLRNMEVTEKYLHLHAGLTKDSYEAGDTVVSVDVAAVSLFPEVVLPLVERIALRIDHHGTAEHFTPLEIVDPTAGATGDILYDILTQMGAVLDKPMAEALYTAISTDTGCFRYPNANGHSFRVAAACHDAGGDLAAINQEIFDTNSLGRLRLQGWIVENIRFLQDGKLAVCALPRAVEAQLGLTEDDLENISGFPRSIEGVKMAATLRQTEDGKVKVSVRAVPGYDAAAVCEKFGGGGHKGAAGANLKLSLEKAAEAVKKEMLDLS